MEKRKTLKVCIVSAVIALIGLISFETVSLRDAQAIPAFARKYDFACNVCHVPGFPKLNDFGNVFRDQGYQLGTDGDLPTFEALGKGFWPVSFRTTAGYELASQRVDGADITGGGVTAAALDILSFGTLARNYSFGIVFTGTTPSPSSPYLESAFVRLMSLERFLGSDNTYLMNLKVGKFELDLPFSEKRSPTLNTSFAMYHYFAGNPFVNNSPQFGITARTLATTNAFNNADGFALGGNQPGVELTGIKRTDLTGGYFRYSLAGITNNFGTGTNNLSCSSAIGTGTPTPTTGAGITSNPGCTDGTGHRFNFYGHVTQSFDGYGIVSGQRVGAFFMYGKAETVDNTVNALPSTAGTGSDFTRLGGDFSLTYAGQWNLFGAYMYAHDSAGLFANTNVCAVGNPCAFQNAAWHGGFAELDYNPVWLAQGKYLFAYRYDLIRNVRQGITAPGGGPLPTPGFNGVIGKNFNDVNSHTVMVRYYIHQSTRTDLVLHAEFNTYRDKGVGLNGGDMIGNVMFVGLDFAF